MSAAVPQAVAIPKLVAFVEAMLVAAGVDQHDAAIVADEVVDAEARGYESQGLMRVTQYVEAARTGATVSPTRMELLRESASARAWNAHDGWGHVAALEAMETCARQARETGACFGVIRDAGHMGRLGYYVERAAELGVIGFISCNGHTGSAVAAPWGGREARLSTNPFAYGFPNADGPPVVVDISTTQSARGKVLVAASRGEEIPDGWAFDAEGEPTTDAAHALPPHGTLAPLGGHKGYALSIVVELLCGSLGGPYPPATTSIFVAAFDPAHVTTLTEYDAAVGTVGEMMRSSALRPGFDAIKLPGEGSAERLAYAEDAGLAVEATIWDGLRTTAESLGLDVAALGG